MLLKIMISNYIKGVINMHKVILVPKKVNSVVHQICFKNKSAKGFTNDPDKENTVYVLKANDYYVLSV